jgi:hypothetical protein
MTKVHLSYKPLAKAMRVPGDKDPGRTPRLGLIRPRRRILMGCPGRPSLNLSRQEIISALRRHRKILPAARELGCSDAYIHVRLKRWRLTLPRILNDDQ